MRYQKKQYAEAVQYKNNEWSDNPFTFSETPLWLEELIKKRQLNASFEGEDYWYLYLDSVTDAMQRGAQRFKVTPDDYIIRYEDGTYGALSPTQFKIWFDELNDEQKANI